MNFLRRYFLKLVVLLGGGFFLSKQLKSSDAESPELEVDESSKIARTPAQNLASATRMRNEPLRWENLSSDVDSINSKYKAVVIGSGYGASVVAARLSEVFKSELCVLERGKEFKPGDYPKTAVEAVKQMRYEHHFNGSNVVNKLGLFSITSTGGVDIVTGNALGGGSNINASVILEPLPEVFAGTVPNINSGNKRPRVWPLQLTDFRPYYKKVRSMLKVERYRFGTWVDDESGGHWELDSQGASRWRSNLADLGIANIKEQDVVVPASPRADKLLSVSGPYVSKKISAATHAETDKNSRLDKELDILPIAVNCSNFDTGISGKMNHVGVPQRLCNGCGDCVSGCNVGAKNTLIMNYIPQAKNNGAKIFTQMEVEYIEKLAPGSGARYRVHYTYFTLRWGLLKSNKAGTIDTDIVVVAAGTLGSTKILVESQKRGGFELSPTLGEKFSGNGDSIYLIKKENLELNNAGFGTTDQPFVENNKSMASGTIAGPCLTTKVDMRETNGIMFQDTGIPSALAFMKSVKGVIDNTLGFLVMGYDSSRGKLSFSEKGNPNISFPNLVNESGHKTARDVIGKIAKSMGGRFIENPFTKLKLPWVNSGEGVPVTVHALGGCSMGFDSANGVINSAGQVFQADAQDPQKVYEGLYVTCGAALPSSVGANPSLTIAAFAERTAAYMMGRPDPADPQKDTASKYKII